MPPSNTATFAQWAAARMAREFGMPITGRRRTVLRVGAYAAQEAQEPSEEGEGEKEREKENGKESDVTS